MGREGDLKLTDIGLMIDPTLTWADIEAFAARSGLPVLVKGMLTPRTPTWPSSTAWPA